MNYTPEQTIFIRTNRKILKDIFLSDKIDILSNIAKQNTQTEDDKKNILVLIEHAKYLENWITDLDMIEDREKETKSSPIKGI